jgi:hypothetical protein
MQILLVSFSIGFGVFMVASVLAWALRTRRYIESHGEPSASIILNGAIWRDYRAARRIADRIGSKPGFLIWSERLSFTAVAFFIAGVLAVLIGTFK